MRKSLLVLLAVVALAAGACGGNDNPGITEPTNTQTTTTPAVSPTATDSPSAACDDQSGTAPFKVEMRDNFFEPTCLIVNASQPITIENKGAAAHTFTIDGTQVDVTVQPGEPPFNGEGNAVAPGEYIFYCKFHGAAAGSGMFGTIIAQ
jgi:plastocyanin